MSYDISLVDPITKDTLEPEEKHHMYGGTYITGGTGEMSLNITYNYGVHFMGMGKKGIRSIYGLSGAESIPILKKAISNLGDDVDDDYWKPTEGNAKRALIQLLSLAQMRPDGIWDGD